MKIKQRIFRYAAQPIVRPWLCLFWIALLSLLAFLLLALLAAQNIFFAPLAALWPFLALISPVLVLTALYHQGQLLRFPFFIQQCLIEPKLRQDLAECALRSSDGVILDYREQKKYFGLLQQTALLIQPHADQPAQWFTADLKHLFSPEAFLHISVRPSPALIEQKVLIYYLARSHAIVQLHAAEDLSNFEEFKHHLPTPFTGKLELARIPSRLMLDLMFMRQIDAERKQGKRFYTLKLAASYGKSYQIQSNAKHFDQLELALSGLIDFVAYRKFKHNAQLMHAVISKSQPFFYRSLVLVLLLIGLIGFAAFKQNTWFILLCAGMVYITWGHLQRLRHSPFIETDTLK